MAGKKKTKTKKTKSGSKKTKKAGSESINGVEKPLSASSKDGKKKKKKSSKLSVADKALIKLEKAVDLLQSNTYLFEHFVQVMDTWLLQKGNKLKLMLANLDSTSEGIVAYEEFKSALFDMDCPASQVEQHLLCKLIDFENTGDVMYENLSQGLRWHMKQSLLGEEEIAGDSDEDEDEEDDQKFRLLRGQSAREIRKCPGCKIGLWTPGIPDVRYIDLNVMLITFADTLRNHPCHFKKTVHSHITVYGIIQLIKAEVEINSTTIAIFRDKTRSPQSQLESHMTLEECGYDGRDWFNPIEHVIFYDYTSEYNECPILMCDHYFSDSLKLA